MPAPAITASNRYTSRAVTKCIWIPAIAATNLTPTRAEINAGTDLSPQIADWDGWLVASEQIETPDLGSRFTSKIPGALSVEDSTLTMYADKAGVDARTLMPRDTSGNIFFADGGDIANNKGDVYPVKVASVGKERSVAGDEADRLQFTYSITKEPAENVTIPA